MLKIIGVVAVALLALIAILLAYAATRPGSFRVERSASIQAPPEKVFALIDDFRTWGQWSPWDRIDPALRRTYSGADAGQGAMYAWEGNNDVGAGSMEITESTPPTRIVIRLDFRRPFEAHNTAEFTLQPQGESTSVTWAMHGPMPFASKVMSVFFSMDRMIGDNFETGLRSLKDLAER